MNDVLLSGLLAMPAFDGGAIAIRILHILPAVLAAGGIFYQLIALHPSLQTLEPAVRRPLREAIVARWRNVVFASILVLLVTGLLNFVLYKIPEYKPHPDKGLYHALFGVKLLLALMAFHGASVLVLPGAKGEKYRDNASFWLPYLAALMVGIIIIGAVLRNFPAASAVAG